MDPEIPELPYVTSKGVRVPHYFDVDWVEKMKDEVKLRADDTWVVTKCGATWTMQIVRLILTGGKDEGKDVLTAAVD